MVSVLVIIFRVPPFLIGNVYFPHGVSGTRPLYSTCASCQKEVVLEEAFKSLKASTLGIGRGNNLHMRNAGNSTFIYGQFRTILYLTFAKTGLVSSLHGGQLIVRWIATMSNIVELVYTAKVRSSQVHSFVSINQFSAWCIFGFTKSAAISQGWKCCHSR